MDRRLRARSAHTRANISFSTALVSCLSFFFSSQTISAVLKACSLDFPIQYQTPFSSPVYFSPFLSRRAPLPRLPSDCSLPT